MKILVDINKKTEYQFVAYFFFVSFKHISLGFHLCLNPLNIEIHLPFGFIRIGKKVLISKSLNYNVKNRIFGIHRYKQMPVPAPYSSWKDMWKNCKFSDNPFISDEERVIRKAGDKN